MRAIIVPMEIDVPTVHHLKFCKYLVNQYAGFFVCLLPFREDGGSYSCSIPEATTMLSYQLADLHLSRPMLPFVQIMQFERIAKPFSQIPFNDLATRVLRDVQGFPVYICLSAVQVEKMIDASQNNFHEWWGTAMKVQLMVAYTDSDEEVYQQVRLTLGTMRSVQYATHEITDPSIVLPTMTLDALDQIKRETGGYLKVKEILGIKAYALWYQLWGNR